MNTQKTIEMVSLERWSCMRDYHVHRTREAAENCIARSKPKTCNTWNAKTMKLIYDMRLSGKTYKECGIAFNICGQQARAVIKKYEYKFLKGKK